MTRLSFFTILPFPFLPPSQKLLPPLNTPQHPSTPQHLKLAPSRVQQECLQRRNQLPPKRKDAMVRRVLWKYEWPKQGELSVTVLMTVFAHTKLFFHLLGNRRNEEGNLSSQTFFNSHPQVFADYIQYTRALDFTFRNPTISCFKDEICWLL